MLGTPGTMTTSGKECEPVLCLYSASLDVLLKEVPGRSCGAGAMSISVVCVGFTWSCEHPALRKMSPFIISSA